MTGPHPDPHPRRTARHSSARNYQKILAAARAVLAESGAGASMEDIAGRAGVGVGTVYRRFASKDALIDELLRLALADLVSAAERALELPGGQGLEALLRAMGESFADHARYASLLLQRPSDPAAIGQITAAVDELTTRATAAGTVGPAITAGDITALIWAMRGLTQAAGDIDPGAWQRFLGFHLAGLRSSAGSAMLSIVTGNEAAERDPDRPGRLLHAERDALLPILRRTPEQAFDRPTACPGWSVRDVLAHCGAALSRAVSGDLHAFTPELNEIDVAERRSWPLADVLAELSTGYEQAGPAMAAAGGYLDAIALGEWLHGGDVREALGEPLAYASDGFDDACVLLGDWTRRRKIPLVEARVSDRSLRFGMPEPDRAPATLFTSPGTLMRLFAGRPADAADYELTGATTAELVVF